MEPSIPRPILAVERPRAIAVDLFGSDVPVDRGDFARDQALGARASPYTTAVVAIPELAASSHPPVDGSAVATDRRPAFRSSCDVVDTVRAVTGTANAVFPLVGVVIGGGITTGFATWTRRQDRRDRNLDLLTEAVLRVHETGTEALHRIDLLFLELATSESFVAVMGSAAFNEMNKAAAVYLNAISRARILATGPTRYNLVEAQNALNEALVAARTAAAFIGKPDHLNKLEELSACLRSAGDTHNAFMNKAVEYLEQLRGLPTQRIDIPTSES